MAHRHKDGAESTQREKAKWLKWTQTGKSTPGTPAFPTESPEACLGTSFVSNMT